jgi:hypothetical protein
LTSARLERYGEGKPRWAMKPCRGMLADIGLAGNNAKEQNKHDGLG